MVSLDTPSGLCAMHNGCIGRAAPRYPVTQLARIDRSLLRGGIGEVLHSATTPARVAIAEWVELARIYSGESTRRLMNGVLGRIATEAGRTAARDTRPTDDAGASSEHLESR